ncbi:MAG TPA: DUF2283 domain-containing protein [Tepidisphaeraceae bacterium]|jgi:uncharacterized protein YuzE
MARKTIKFEYDPEVDAAYVKLSRGKILESEEVQPGVILDLGAKGQLLGLEILRFTKRFANQIKSKPTKAMKKSA